MKKFIDFVILKPFFFIIAILSFGTIYTPTNFKLYRKWQGGIWYNYIPVMFQYMSFWTQDKDNLQSHEIVVDTEDYTSNIDSIYDHLNNY